MDYRNNGRRNAESQRMAQKKRPRKRFLFLYFGIFLIVIGVFAIFRWAVPTNETVIENPNRTEAPASSEAPSSEGTPAPAETGSPAPSATPSATAKPVTKTENSYDSENLTMSISNHEDQVDGQTVKYFVVDIQLKDMSLFKTAFSGSGDGISNEYENPLTLLEENNGLLGINCDNSGYLSDGIIVRNGELYRFRPSDRDVCMIFSDGTMRVAQESSFSSQDEIFDLINNEGLLHTFSFGPALIENGQGRGDYSDSNVQTWNPRTAIGMIEPYHFVFVVVDGRTDDTAGMRLIHLEELMSSLGCQVAYNFDGGQSSILMYDGNIVNNIAGRDEPRGVTDIVYLSEN